MTAGRPCRNSLACASSPPGSSSGATFSCPSRRLRDNALAASAACLLHHKVHCVLVKLVRQHSTNRFRILEFPGLLKCFRRIAPESNNHRLPQAFLPQFWSCVGLRSRKLSLQSSLKLLPRVLVVFCSPGWLTGHLSVVERFFLPP